MALGRPRILFQTYSRRGLGHLRRGLNVAQELRRLSPTAEILFYTRGEPPRGFTKPAVRFCCESIADPSSRWSDVMRSFSPHVVIFDTMLPKDWDPSMYVNTRTVYIMRKCQRETHEQLLRDPFLVFVDAIIVPHSQHEFGMKMPTLVRSKTTFVGNIVSSPCRATRACLQAKYSLTDGVLLLVSTPGGGGFQQQADTFFDIVFGVHLRLARSPLEFRHIVVQGPRYTRRLRALAGMTIVDEEPGLVSLIDLADLVISAGGYNTVNEIRALKTPAVFLPSARSHDDQEERVANLTEAGLALSFPDLRRDALIDRIASACQSPETRRAMRERYAGDTMKTGNRAAARQILGLLNR